MIGLGLALGLRSGGGGPSVPAPTNTVAPVVSGTPSVGQVLTTTNGTWTGSPTGYTYQWRRGGVAISGATAATYTVQAADVGTTLTCAVTATNAGGSATAVSNGVAVSAAKTYEDWVVEASRISPSATSWTANSVGLAKNERLRTTGGSISGSMYGSPWNYAFTSATIARVIQHALPSQAVFNDQGGRPVVFRLIDAGDQAGFTSINRNGYTSLSDPNTYPGQFCDLVIWWDETAGKVLQNNPLQTTAPIDYTWP